jgi:hypothetical protein
MDGGRALMIIPPDGNLTTWVPSLVTAAGERASMRFLEFFAANIRNPHTRRAYARAVEEFLIWCADAGVPLIGAVHPVHVATWIEAGTRERCCGCTDNPKSLVAELHRFLARR